MTVLDDGWHSPFKMGFPLERKNILSYRSLTPIEKGGRNLTPIEKGGRNLIPIEKGGRNLTPIEKGGRNLTAIQKGSRNLKTGRVISPESVFIHRNLAVKDKLRLVGE